MDLLAANAQRFGRDDAHFGEGCFARERVAGKEVAVAGLSRSAGRECNHEPAASSWLPVCEG